MQRILQTIISFSNIFALTFLHLTALWGWMAILPVSSKTEGNHIPFLLGWLCLLLSWYFIWKRLAKGQNVLFSCLRKIDIFFACCIFIVGVVFFCGAGSMSNRFMAGGNVIVSISMLLHMKKRSLHALLVSGIIGVLLWGLPNRKWENSNAYEEELRWNVPNLVQASPDHIGACASYGYDSQKLEQAVLTFFESGHRTRYETSFLCYAALKMENESVWRKCRQTPHERPVFQFQWGGLMAPEKKSVVDPNMDSFCFTLFMVTTNSRMDVVSFEWCRNAYSRQSSAGRHYRYEQGRALLNIWDGHLSDLNHPETIFLEQHQSVIAIQTQRPFNYEAYLTPHALRRLEDDLKGSPRLFRLKWQTKESMIFVPETIMPEDASYRMPFHHSTS